MTKAGASHIYVSTDLIRLAQQARDSDNVKAREKRKHIIETGNSCLTCSHTKVCVGKSLYCKLKSKYVTQYNYCEKWKKP